MSRPIKILTVHQPWAWAIAAGLKPIENRSWTTRYRGPLLIHAGRSTASLRAGRRYLSSLGYAMPDDRDLAFGAIVARAELVDCVPLRRVAGQEFAEGPYCWVLRSPEPLDRPIRCAGRQGLFDVPAGIASRLVGVEPPPPAWTAGMLPLH